MKHRKSDSLWKTAMEEFFPELMRFIFVDADVRYDLGRGFEFLDKELTELNPHPEEATDSRFADKLVKLYRRNGEGEVIILHIEVQGDTSDREAFAERMFTYFYRIRDKYPGIRVTALAIFAGQDADKMPGEYYYQDQNTVVIYRYPTISVLSYSDEELDKSVNPFAQIFAAAKMRLLEEKLSDDELFDIKLTAANKLRERGFSPEKVRALFTFLNNYVLFNEPETYRKFENQFKITDKFNIMTFDEFVKNEGREEGIEIGLEKGREEGREEGKEQASDCFCCQSFKGFCIYAGLHCCFGECVR